MCIKTLKISKDDLPLGHAFAFLEVRFQDFWYFLRISPFEIIFFKFFIGFSIDGESVFLIVLLVHLIEEGDLIEVLLHFADDARNVWWFYLLSLETLPLHF